MTEERKNVHILVPRGFQNREMLKGSVSNLQQGQNPATGECMNCKGTGAIFERFAIVNPTVSDGRIVTVEKTLMTWAKCRCYMGQFWRSFHPVNVRARLLPKWEKEVREAIEQEKARIISESGGNYDPHNDSFLKDLGLQNQNNKDRILSLDEILTQALKQKGDFIV